MGTSGSGLSVTKHARLIAAQRGLCALCGLPFVADDFITLDHIVPRSKGGSDAVSNLQAAHGQCNFLRGSLSMEDWKRLRPQLLHGITSAPQIPAVKATTIIIMGERMALLERANKVLSADWQRMKDEYDEVVRLVGYGEGTLPERVKKLLSAARKWKSRKERADVPEPDVRPVSDQNESRAQAGS